MGIGVGMFDSFRILMIGSYLVASFLHLLDSHIPNSDQVRWRLKKSEEDSTFTLSIMLLGAKSCTLPLERHLGCYGPAKGLLFHLDGSMGKDTHL